MFSGLFNPFFSAADSSEDEWFDAEDNLDSSPLPAPKPETTPTTVLKSEGNGDVSSSTKLDLKFDIHEVLQLAIM